MSILDAKLQNLDEEKHEIQHCIINYSVLNATAPLNHILCRINARKRLKMKVYHRA